VRLSATQTDSIKWEISADDGVDWQDVPADWEWHPVVPGSNIRWRAALFCEGAVVGPACTHLEIEWSDVLTSGVDDPDAADLPASFALRPGQPNPFSLRISIGFDLPVSSTVSLKVFDAQGRLVRTLMDQACPAGRHSAVWAGDDDDGRPVGSGIYFVRMEARGFKDSGKILLAR
jgi:hypothetical protein